MTDIILETPLLFILFLLSFLLSLFSIQRRHVFYLSFLSLLLYAGVLTASLILGSNLEEELVYALIACLPFFLFFVKSFKKGNES